VQCNAAQRSSIPKSLLQRPWFEQLWKMRSRYVFLTLLIKSGGFTSAPEVSPLCQRPEVSGVILMPKQSKKEL